MAEQESNRCWRRSQEMLARSRLALAGGVSSPFRAAAPVPLFFEDGAGSRLRDVDGNEYIDYALAWGPLILGHKHRRLIEAMRRQAERPHLYGAQHELEIEVAEAVQRLVPCAERVAFTSSGSEALQIAMRLARAFTGRPLILKFEGHYHGWMDSALISYHPAAQELPEYGSTKGVLGSRGQVANAADGVVVAPWNDLETVTAIMRSNHGEIAAVVTEPILCNSGCLMPRPGFLAALADLCRGEGSLLIFDEVITGFRVASGGAQSRFGVVPDLGTFGKAIAGGLPLSAIAGRREILEMMFGGGVAWGGTFNGNPISLAAAAAVLDEISKNDDAALRCAASAGEALMRELRGLGVKHGVPLKVTGTGVAFSVHFTVRDELNHYRDVLDDDKDMLRHFLREALAEGLFLLPDGRFYVSAVHSERDVEETVAVFDRVLGRLLTRPIGE